MVNRYTPVSKSIYKRPLFYVVLVVLLVAGGSSLYWWHRDHTYKKVQLNNHKVATANPNVPGGHPANGNPTTGASASKDRAENTPGPTISPSLQPSAPTGTFVSNHSPNLSGKPNPNTEASTCTTTPGAKCQIKFTSGNIVKELPAQTTDANGNTSWGVWTLQSVGLSQGTWKVTAIATNGSNSATTQDINNLVISQ